MQGKFDVWFSTFYQLSIYQRQVFDFFIFEVGHDLKYEFVKQRWPHLHLGLFPIE